MDSVHGGSGSFPIQSFYSNFPKLASPDASKPTVQLFSSPKMETFDSKAADGGTSGSQSSSSSHSLSGGTHHSPPGDEESGSGALKRTKIDSDIHTFGASNDHNQDPTVNEAPKSQTLPPKPRGKPEGHLWRVKVTFGEDKIRFRMQKNWGFNDLLQEISKRLCLNDISGYSLKYLDDDSEWVLLTCDEDVEECIDVYRSYKGGTIRLTLREPALRVGSSLGSNAPL